MTQKLLMANKKPLRRERNMQRTSSELSNTNTKIKVIGKKIGKKRAIFNVPKSHQHMSHKVAQKYDRSRNTSKIKQNLVSAPPSSISPSEGTQN